MKAVLALSLVSILGLSQAQIVQLEPPLPLPNHGIPRTEQVPVVPLDQTVCANQSAGNALAARHEYPIYELDSPYGTIYGIDRVVKCDNGEEVRRHLASPLDDNCDVQWITTTEFESGGYHLSKITGFADQ